MQQWKLPVAGIAAAGCVGLMASNLIPSRTERTDIPKPLLVRADGTTPAPQARRRPAAREMNWETAPEDAGKTYTFDRVSNTDDVARQMDALNAAITARPEGSAPLAEDLRTLLEPLNAGSADSFAQAIAALGGTTQPANDGRSPVDGFSALFRGLLAFAALDTANIEIRKPTTDIPPSDGISIGMNRNISPDPDTGEEIETVSHTVTGSPSSMFPNASGENAKGRLVEMRLPFLAKGSKSDTPDVIVLLQMREVAPSQWQPAGFFIDVRNEPLMQSVLKEVMGNRQPQGPG